MQISLLNNKKIGNIAIYLSAVMVVLMSSGVFAQDSEHREPVPATASQRSEVDSWSSSSATREYSEYNGQSDLSLEAFQNVKRENSQNDPASLFGNASDMEEAALAIRRDAQKEAALSYGARGGLQWRTLHIVGKLEKQAIALDEAFNFRRLLIKAPTNLLIEPPIIREAIDALLVDSSGQEAAVADTIYNISKNAKIVTSSRTWRDYLYRGTSSTTEEIALPPTILLPENPDEQKLWKHWVQVGWEQGIKQADAIFENDVENLVADYQGMVRYRILLAEGKVSPPYAVLEDRGITGGGSEMRIGDRAIRITGPSKLKASMGGQTWTPGIR